MKRRLFLTCTGVLALAGSVLSLPSVRAAEGTAPKRILLFTKSSGFEHSVVKRKGDAPSLVEKVLTELGAKNNFEVTATKDGSVFTPENIARYDAFFFYTTGDLTKPGTDKNPPMTTEGKAAFLEAIKNGKGFIGTHAATDTFHTAPDTGNRATRYVNHGEQADPYVRMIGAEFIKHGPQQKARMIAIDSHFPGFEEVGEGFEMMEEWYSLHDFAPNLHVLLVQDTKGMRGEDYQRAPFPATWARREGKGRVFYTSMGHREDVWNNPAFQKMLLGGIHWALGRVEANVTPNLEKAAPGYREIPPRPAPKKAVSK